MSQRSLAEEAFWAAWEAIAPAGHDLIPQHRFDPVRRWRFDAASPMFKVAVEIDGQGAHQRIPGARNDYEKANAAQRQGWMVLRYLAVDRAHADDWAREVLEAIIERSRK